MEFHFVVKAIKKVTQNALLYFFWWPGNFCAHFFLFASFFFLIEPEKYIKLKDKDRERPYYNNIKKREKNLIIMKSLFASSICPSINREQNEKMERERERNFQKNLCLALYSVLIANYDCYPLFDLQLFILHKNFSSTECTWWWIIEDLCLCMKRWNEESNDWNFMEIFYESRFKST